MNIINVSVDFKKGTCTKDGIRVVTGDFNSTKLVFDFDTEIGTKIFEMKNTKDELIYLDEIKNNEINLVGIRKDTGEFYSLFDEEGNYTFEISLYENGSKLTSASNYIVARKEQVEINGELVEKYLPVFEKLMKDLTSLESFVEEREETRNNNEGIRIHNESLRIQAEDERETYINDLKERVEAGEFNGEDGKDALINGVNTLNIVEGEGINIKQEGSTLTIENDFDASEIEQSIQTLGNTVADIDRELSNAQNDIEHLETTQQGLIEDVQELSDNMELYSLVDETGNKIKLVLDTKTYKLKTELYNKNSVLISTSNEIDLPLESLVLNVEYDNATKELVITLENGTITRVPIGSLISGLVSEEQLNNKLIDYVKNTDYGTSSKAGIILPSNGIATSVSNGATYGVTYTNAEYVSRGNGTIISKGTLENVIAGKELTNKTYVDELVSEVVEDFSKDQLRQDEDITQLESIVPKKTSSGSPLTYSNALEYKIFDSEIEGNDKQETTTGKNRLNFSKETYNDRGLTTTKIGNGGVRVTGTATATATYLAFDDDIDMPIGNYVFSLKDNSPERIRLIPVTESGVTEGSATIEIGSKSTNLNVVSNMTKYRLLVFTEINKNYDFTIYPMIRLASITDDTFEPYTGGQPSPSPDYPQEIEVLKGYNLWNNELENKEYDTTGNKIDTSVWVTNIEKIKVKPNTLYFVNQKETPSQYRIIFFNDDTYIGKSDNAQNRSTGYKNYTFTTPNNCNYIYIQFRSIIEKISETAYIYPQDITKVLLVEGTEKPYIPYNSIGIKRIGKNIFDEVKSGGNVTLLKDKNKLYWNNTSSAYYFYDFRVQVKPNTKYTFSLKNKSVSIVLSKSSNATNVVNWDVVNGNTYTTPNDMNEFYIRFTMSSVGECYVDEFMISENGGEYEPYQERIDYIKLEQEDLCDIKLTNSLTSTILYKTYTLQPNTNYTVSSNTYLAPSAIANVFCASGTTLTPSSVGNGVITSRTITSDNNGNITIAYRNYDNTLDYGSGEYYIRIFKGNGAYDGSGILPEDNLKIDRYGKVKLIKNWGKIVLDGGENWVTSSTKTSGDYRIRTYGKYTNIKANEKDSDISNIISNYFIATSPNKTYSLENGICVDTNNYIYIYDKSFNTNDISLFKSWVSTHPIEVYYELATPQEIDLPDIEPLKSLNGTNNVEVLSKLPPTYMSETYVNDLQAEIDELKNALLSTGANV